MHGMHGRRHHYGHYGQCPYKFWEAPKLVRNVRTSFGRFFLFKKESFKNGQTFNKSRYNFEKKFSEFLKI